MRMMGSKYLMAVKAAKSSRSYRLFNYLFISFAALESGTDLWCPVYLGPFAIAAF